MSSCSEAKARLNRIVWNTIAAVLAVLRQATHVCAQPEPVFATQVSINCIVVARNPSDRVCRQRRRSGELSAVCYKYIPGGGAGTSGVSCCTTDKASSDHPRRGTRCIECARSEDSGYFAVLSEYRALHAPPSKGLSCDNAPQSLYAHILSGTNVPSGRTTSIPRVDRRLLHVG